jgi:hypothetical protein
VEIGLVDFHGWWEEWETALSISARSIDRHFHVCFGCRLDLRGGQRTSILPAALELYG